MTYTREHVLNMLKFFREGGAYLAFSGRTTVKRSGREATEEELLKMWHDSQEQGNPGILAAIGKSNHIAFRHPTLEEFRKNPTGTPTAKQLHEYPHTPQECYAPITGRYVVVDDFNGSVNLVTDEDGVTKEFRTYAGARYEADECQNGIVVQLS